MDKVEKIGATALLSALFTWLGVIAVPFLLLVMLQIIDYTTGVFAAKYRSEAITSYKSFQGIARKICMWLLVLVGGALDWLITYTSGSLGMQISSIVVATIVCVWLMCNEIISILENMADIGVKVPLFLLKTVEKIRDKAESEADIGDSNGNKEDNDDGVS